MSGDITAVRFCKAVSTHPQMSNATARIGAWLIGAAAATGGFPLELTLRQIQTGFTRNGRTVQGTGSRPETIRASLEWLEANGYLNSVDGRRGGFGHYSRIYSMEV